MTTLFGQSDEDVLVSNKQKKSENSTLITKPHEKTIEIAATLDSYNAYDDELAIDILHYDDDLGDKEPEYNFATARHKESVTNVSSISFVSSKPENTHCNDAHKGNFSQSISSIEEYIDTFSDADNCCIGKDIINCIGLQRIISILSFYDSNCNNYDAVNQYLSKYNLSTHLLNDYHHILDKHLNEDNISKRKVQKQFETIYHEMMDTNTNDLSCDIETCDIWIRNNRRRETTQIECNDDKLCVFIDLLDTIHCYFMHSVDIGHRLISDDYRQYMSCDANGDINFTNLRRYLSHKQHKNVALDCDTRFVTNLKHRVTEKSGYLRKESLYLKQIRLRYIVLRDKHLYSYKTDKRAELTECISLNEYSHVQICIDGRLGEFELINNNSHCRKRVFIASSLLEMDEWLSVFADILSADRLRPHFGERFNYWSDDISYPKYESLKEELTHNSVYSLSVCAFSLAFNKAIHLLDSHLMRNMMCCREIIDKYNIGYDATPRIDHILSVVLWCDYRAMSSVFSSQFNRISKQMYDELWILSKFLIESVNAFGCRLKKSKHKMCYHLMNINDGAHFLENETLFNGAIATTTIPMVILLQSVQCNGGGQGQGQSQGIVLELTNYKKLRYFNCSFVSYRGNENERLFIQPPFVDKHCAYYAQIASIYNVSTSERYREYIVALNILKMLFNNECCMDSFDCDENVMRIIKYLLSILLNECACDNVECPRYVELALLEWSANVTNIRFNTYLNNKIVCDLDLYCENIEYLVRFDKLNRMFQRLNSVYIEKEFIDLEDHDKEDIDWKCIASMLSMLDNLNELQYSQLKQIYIQYNHDMDANNWTQYQQLIHDKKWQMDMDIEQKVIKITRN